MRVHTRQLPSPIRTMVADTTGAPLAPAEFLLAAGGLFDRGAVAGVQPAVPDIALMGKLTPDELRLNPLYSNNL